MSKYQTDGAISAPADNYNRAALPSWSNYTSHSTAFNSIIQHSGQFKWGINFNAAPIIIKRLQSIDMSIKLLDEFQRFPSRGKPIARWSPSPTRYDWAEIDYYLGTCAGHLVLLLTSDSGCYYRTDRRTQKRIFSQVRLSWLSNNNNNKN